MFATAVVLVLISAEPAASELLDATPDSGVAFDAGVVAEAEPPDATTRLAGHFGLGTFGSAEFTWSQVFVNTPVTTTTPFIGARYWTPLGGTVLRRVGVEVAGGMWLSSGSTETAAGTTTATQKNPTIRTFGLHVAVPVALISTPHFIGHLSPEFRYLVLERDTSGMAPLVTSGPQRSSGASAVHLAVRAAAEVFFGFVKIPNLSLELSLRFGVRLNEIRSTDQGSLTLMSSLLITSPFPSDIVSLITSMLALKYYL